VWTVGEEGIFHFDGTAWDKQDEPSEYLGFQAVWASGAADAWAIGFEGWFRFDGQSWTMQWNEELFFLSMGIWGARADAVWAVGFGGIGFFDGNEWEVQYMATGKGLLKVHGSSTSDVWAVGMESPPMHFNGTSWAAPAQDLPQVDLYAVSGDRAGGLWAVGNLGTILRRKDGDWSVVPSGTLKRLRGVWAVAADDAWAVGMNQTVLRWNGVEWSPAYDNDPRYDLYSVWATGTEVWAVGEDRVLHFDGTTWHDDHVPPDFEEAGYLMAVWGWTANDVWAVGEYVYRWNGSSWTIVYNDNWDELYAIWGAAADDVWMAGSDYEIIHFDGTNFQSHTVQPGDDSYYYLGICGTGASDLWVVGEFGAMARGNGTQWNCQAPFHTRQLNACWGEPGKGVWAVGERGAILWRKP
jgi:hypothetical protein